MLGLLERLWPDFSALETGGSLAISVWFWLTMVVIFLVTLLLLWKNRRRFLARLQALNGLLKNLDKDNMALSRREIRQKALALKNLDARLLWLEFDDSLVTSGNQKQLFSTLGASYFFNGKTLARGLTSSRLLAAVPSFLVALGVLGTFVGLTIGLSGLVGTSDEVEALKGGINELISGASVAFMTSVWGVLLSLVLNFVEKILEAQALAKISKLQHHIDRLYQQLPAEQSLLYIAENSQESKQSLQELHERIGDRLQETLSGMSLAMQEAVTEALNKVMAPAIQALVNSSSEQSSHALTTLVDKFMTGMLSAGREQGGQMQQAAADVNSAVANMGERLEHLFTNLSGQQSQQLELANQQRSEFSSQLRQFMHSADQKQEQLEQRFGELLSSLSSQMANQADAADSREQSRQRRFDEQLDAVSSHQNELLNGIASATEVTQLQSLEMAKQHQQLLGLLKQSTEAVLSSSKNMDSSANQLGLLSTNVRQASDFLGQRLDAVTEGVSNVSAESKVLAQQLQSQADSLSKLQATLLQGAERFEQAAEIARDGFGDMNQNQEVFLAGVKHEFTSLGETSMS